MDILEQYRGALLGLAVGDALGTTLEFRAPGSFTPIRDMLGGGPFGLQPGQWTDDTSMALCLAESLITCRVFDAVDQLRRYLRWYREGHLSSTGACFDIGNTVRAALGRFEAGGRIEPWCGSEDPRSAGNGSLMRLAPVPLFYHQRPREALARAADSSRTTHAARAAVDACRYYAGLLLGALNGAGKAELLAARYTPVSGYWQEAPLCPEIEAVADGSFKARQPPEIRGSGYVAQSLEAALWAFYHSDSYAEGALLAVNLGDDADTTGAIYGQLAGAFYGQSAIPESWQNQISHHGLLVNYATQLYWLRPAAVSA